MSIINLKTVTPFSHTRLKIYSENEPFIKEMEYMKKYLSLISALCFIGGCSYGQEGVSSLPLNTKAESSGLTNYDILEETDTFTNRCEISLGDDININGEGAWIDNNCITISESGVYTISGQLSDGMIYVECTDKVKIILDGVNITKENGSAVISNSERLILKSQDGKENTLASNGGSDAAVYSVGELVLVGNGVLSVSGEGDGIKSDSGIELTECKITVAAGNDGIEAEKKLTASNAAVAIDTTGDIIADEELSSKGIKAGEMELDGCSVTINSTDHAVKADGAILINGGAYTIASSAGKGISADGVLTLDGADILISDSEEGLESKTTLTIESGNINITSTDDGINTGGDDEAVDHSMIINGGTVIVNAEGDGLDSNGDIRVTGGTVVVFGPVADGNAPLDYGDNGNSMTVTGGKVLAVGSAGMMVAPKDNYIASRNLNAQENDKITVADNDGNIIISAVLPKSAQGVIFSDGTSAEGYKLYKNGNVSGDADENGIITDGTIAGGTAVEAGALQGFGGMGHGGFDGGMRPDGQPPAGEPPAMPENGEMGTPPAIPDGGMPPENTGGEPPVMPEGEAPAETQTP